MNILLARSNNQFQNYESDFSQIWIAKRNKFSESCYAWVLYQKKIWIFLKNSGFIVSELVIGAGEQDDDSQKFRVVFKVSSAEEACAKCFAVHNVHISKFEILQITLKNWNKEIRPLVFSFSPIDLSFWCFLFYFFMWFASFQILIWEPQSILCKLLTLSWLYKENLCVTI